MRRRDYRLVYADAESQRDALPAEAQVLYDSLDDDLKKWIDYVVLYCGEEKQSGYCELEVQVPKSDQTTNTYTDYQVLMNTPIIEILQDLGFSSCLELNAARYKAEPIVARIILKWWN